MIAQYEPKLLDKSFSSKEKMICYAKLVENSDMFELFDINFEKLYILYKKT